MKFRTKATIFVAALIITLMGFNFIVSQGALDLFKTGGDTGFKIVSDNLVQDTTPHKITVKG